MPAWHLDFRNTSRLPDVKPIRTAFFVNGISVVLAIIVSLNFAKQEFALYNLRSQIADWEQEIESDRMPSAQAVKKFQQFKAEEKKITEAGEFVKTEISPADFLMRMGVILPEQIIIETIDWRDDIFTLRGTVSGAPDEASGYASGLVDTLGEDEELGPLFKEVSLTSLARNPATGLLAMEIRMTLKSL